MNTSGFARFARLLSIWSGKPHTFFSAVLAIALWGLTGPFFGFSDTWQLVVNTTTTIVTFLMVFVIQNTQNRDTAAIQIKLDELIRSTQGAHNALLGLEELDDRHLEAYRAAYAELAERSRAKLHSGELDIDCPEIKDWAAEA